jgi:hypothetical protein
MKWLSLLSLLLERPRHYIDDPAVVHVSAAFPRQVRNDPIEHITFPVEPPLFFGTGKGTPSRFELCYEERAERKARSRLMGLFHKKAAKVS